MKNWHILWVLLLLISSCRSEKDTKVTSGGDPSVIRLYEILLPKQTGIGFENRLTEDLDHNSVNDVYFYNGSGLSIADFNNDGWTDLFTLDMTAEDNFSIKASMGSMNELLFTTLVDLGQHQQYMFNTVQVNNGVSGENRVPLFSDIAQITGISNTDWSWAPCIRYGQ